MFMKNQNSLISYRKSDYKVSYDDLDFPAYSSIEEFYVDGLMVSLDLQQGVMNIKYESLKGYDQFGNPRKS